MKNRLRFAALLLTLPLHAYSQSETPWSGATLGIDMGNMSSHACSAWTPSSVGIDPNAAAPPSQQSCSPSGHFLAALQLGESFQYQHLTWGFGMDLDTAVSKTSTSSVKSPAASLSAGATTSTGAAPSPTAPASSTAPPPAGTYAYSSRPTPSALAIIGPRIGYAGELLQPYLRAGALIAGGAHSSTITFTPRGATKPTISFDGTKDFSSLGWAAGGGTEIGLNGPWSVSLEYLHVSLGKDANGTANCSGTAAACSPFSGIVLANRHDPVTANIYRLGITYWFGYWGQ